MEQNNKNVSNISHPNYNPAEDPEVDEDMSLVLHNLKKIREKFDPYQRWIMIVGFTILIFLVVFLGYARGALDICTSLDGLLDDDFKCHPGYYTVNITKDRVGQTFNILKVDVKNATE